MGVIGVITVFKEAYSDTSEAVRRPATISTVGGVRVMESS